MGKGKITSVASCAECAATVELTRRSHRDELVSYGWSLWDTGWICPNHKDPLKPPARFVLVRDIALARSRMMGRTWKEIGAEHGFSASYMLIRVRNLQWELKYSGLAPDYPDVVAWLLTQEEKRSKQRAIRRDRRAHIPKRSRFVHQVSGGLVPNSS